MNLCKLFTFILFCLTCNAYAQNLVPNGSFEEIINCPQYLGDIANTVGWYGSIQVPGVPMNENPSTDWYHTCSESNLLSPPVILFGAYQEPLDGDGYAGIITYGLIDPNYREYLGIELTESLEVGQPYQVIFNMVRSPGGSNSIASNNQGVKFSRQSIYFTPEAITNNFSHFNIDTLVADTVDWKNFSFEFIADSAYQFVHFGNFYTDENTDYGIIGEAFQHRTAYYLFDDISITKTVPNKISEIENNNIILYPNPSTNGKFTIVSKELINEVRIADCLGRTVYFQENIGSKTVEIRLKDYKVAGIYFVSVKDNTGQSIIIKHLHF